MSSSDTSLRSRSVSSSSSRRSNRRHPHPSSPSPRHGSPISIPRKRPLLSQHIDILPKCSSEPSLGFVNGASPTDVFSLSYALLSPDCVPFPNEVYDKDTKVVVTVTVEGSPGPIRAMVKLGTTVEETIKLLVEKYDKEGRFPRLDVNATSIYELHHSYFSLESLERSDSIGDVGSRNFYLRKGDPNLIQTTLKASSNITPDEPSIVYQARVFPSMVFFPGYVTRKTSKIVRRMRKLWKMLGCLHSSA